MNFEKCAFCRKRIPKTARMDAMYCSPGCRMNALRIRKREKRLAERAAAKAKEGNASDGQARMQALRAAFLARIQGARLAAGQPNLVEHPWLTLRAEVSVCDKLIAYYTEKRTAAQAQLDKMREPEMTISYKDVKAADALSFSSKATHVGLAMESVDFDGEAMVYVAEPCPKGEFVRKTFYYPGASKFGSGS